MPKNQRPDPAITSVQKLITLSMLAFMAFLFISQERENQVVLPEDMAVEQPQTAENLPPVKVQITNMQTGAVSYSDLSKGQIVIGKWSLELAKDEPEQPKLELVEPEKAKKPAQTPIPAAPAAAEPKKVETLPAKSQ